MAGMYSKPLEMLAIHKLHLGNEHCCQCIQKIKLLRHEMFPSRCVHILFDVALILFRIECLDI